MLTLSFPIVWKTTKEARKSFIKVFLQKCKGMFFMKENDKPRPMGERLNRWIEAYEIGHGGRRLTHAEIAKVASIDASKISRIINHEDGEFTEREIVALANFFNISCDEFLTGISYEKKDVRVYLGLDEQAAKTLIRLNRTDPKLANVLDVILSNEYIADAFLRMFLLYAEVPVLKVSQWNSNDPNDSILLTSQFGDEIVKAMVISCFEQILNDFRREWKKRSYNSPKFVLTQKQVKLVKKHLDPESLQRMQRKRIILNLRKEDKPKPMKQYMDIMEKIIMSRMTDVISAREAARNKEEPK